MHHTTLPPARSVKFNPTQAELRSLVSNMSSAALTEFDNYNVQTKVTSRSKGSTFVVTDEPALHSGKTISRQEGAHIAAVQDEYISKSDMLVIDGYIGNDPTRRTATRLYIEAANANIAAMQQLLYFHDGPEGEDFRPELTVIYTPNLPASGYPDDRIIACDLEAGVTRVLNSDYFGESKKGGLRMWNALIYEQGGLPLHAGCKVIPTANGDKVVLVVGLSGTGKTTTTFTRQNGSLPVQDDFVALWPDGRITATENGCFAKTFGLDPKFEPMIYGAVTKKEAYLENVSQTGKKIDFFDTTYTQNGRAVFRMDLLEAYKQAGDISKVDYLLILNRNDNIIPAVAHLSTEQAAAYFMLGETQGTSAGGADEMGKFLRVPGTNPFFPLQHDLQGNRFLELHDKIGFDVFLMNTGRVGGKEADERSKKITIPYSSAIVKGIVEGTIGWITDPDFGYQVASRVDGIDDVEVLQPSQLYAREGRAEEYQRAVAQVKAERKEYFQQYPELAKTIATAAS